MLLIAYLTRRSHEGVIVRGLTVPPVVGLGRISYGVYLWHYPIVLLVAAHMGGSPWARLPVVAIAAVVAATLSYRFVEAPFLRLKDRLGAGPAQGPRAIDPEQLAPRT